MPATDAPLLRPMDATDLPFAYRLSGSLGWPHRLEDWQVLLGLGAGLVAERGGVPLGTVMGWRFGPAEAALGMVIVAREAQGQGIGRALVQAMMASLGPRGIALNATAEGMPLYASLGFLARGRVLQQQGAALSGELPPLRPGERLRPAAHNDARALAALDEAACGARRDGVIATLLAGSEGIVLERGGMAAGFALLRRFGRGHVLGPVVAPDEASARALIAHWLRARVGQFLRIDIPEESGLSDWLAGRGLVPVDHVIPMRRGAWRSAGAAVRRFALASQALG